jgi:hypothetical protein
VRAAHVEETAVVLLVIFGAIFVAGQLLNVAISIGVEQFSKQASLIVFFGLLGAVVFFGWQLAVRLTDYLVGTERIRQVARGR